MGTVPGQAIGGRMSDIVPDDVLKQIAEGSGRTYSNEGKKMAAELIKWRAAKKAAQAQGNTGSGWPPGFPP
jgi:hypothetical protein